MKAIQTKNVSDNDGFLTETEYMMQIDGKWHKVTCVEKSILDGRHACSRNVYKWDMLGKAHCFKIEQCEEPEQEVPKEVEAFIQRFRENGENSATLTVPRDDEYAPDPTRYPGHVWGWVKKMFKHDYVC